jgi:hypothetical protein
MKIWYFETSAVNELMKDHSVEDALATKQLQLNKGREWRLSPVTLWEILMTSDEKRQDEIVYFCQHLFSRELLPSPAELIIPYIEQGMPKIEKERKLISKTAIANTWRELVDDRRRCFIYDGNELAGKAKLLQENTRNIHEIVKNGEFIISSIESFSSLDLSLSDLVNELPFIKSGEQVSNEERLAYKVSLYYIFMILCAEAELDNEVIKIYWNKIGVNSILDRTMYVIKELPELVHRGPFIIMACMTISQSQGKYPRGVWFDSLHSMYLTYADKIFTSDGHFQGLREIISAPDLQSKIHNMNEVEITHYELNQFGL